MKKTSLAIAILLATAAIALACGIVIDRSKVDPDNRARTTNMVHKDFKLEVKIREQVAEVTVKPVFHNPNDFAIEGTYFLSLPSGAQVKEFLMKVGDKEQKAELLDAAKARQVYTTMVQQNRDPALLELVGSQMIRANIFPIAAKSDVSVTISYTVLLRNEAGVVEVDLPFSNQFVGDQTAPNVAVSMEIESKIGLKNIYSPTHAVDVVKKSDHAAKVTYEAANYAVRKPFKLYYTVSDDDLGLTLLTFRDPGEAGYFVLMASPRVKVAEAQIMPKDVVFVMDRSGSMAGEKIRQARAALIQCVDGLNARDRFNIVDFSSEAEAWDKELVEATRENRARAIRYVEGLKAAGSTNISDALATAMPLLTPDPTRLSILLFATDGLPTVGDQNMSRILDKVKEKNAPHIRIFAFGVGNDVNTQFLDKLAEDHRGARDYVAQEEKIEAKVGALFDKISNPVLANVEMDFGKDVKLVDVYPRQLPDLFKGSQLVVFGRYEGSGPTTVTLKGRAGAEAKVFRCDVNLPEKDLRNDFVPRLWASRKVAYLIDAIRLNGNPSKEVVDEIVALAKKHGIVTPYTSFLVTDDATADHNESAKGEFHKLADRAENSGKPQAGGGAAPATPAKEPPQAQKESDELKRSKEDPSADAMDKKLRAIEKEKGGTGGVKIVGNHTFFVKNGIWTDSLYDAAKMASAAVKIKYMSDDYFQWLEKKPDLAKFFAVGEQVIVVLDGTAYQTVK